MFNALKIGVVKFEAAINISYLHKLSELPLSAFFLSCLVCMWILGWCGQQNNWVNVIISMNFDEGMLWTQFYNNVMIMKGMHKNRLAYNVALQASFWQANNQSSSKSINSKNKVNVLSL